jgi:hypothetical protein
MHRAQFITGLIIVSALLAPSMFCLIPGAAMTAAEMECCRLRMSTCGDMPMEHSCCKPSTPSGEFGLIAQKLRPPVMVMAVLENVVGFPVEVQNFHAWYGVRSLALEHLPSSPSIAILRI